MVQKLIIIGASNALSEVKGIIFAINHVRPTFEIVGALDDDLNLSGALVDGVPVIGTLSTATGVSEDISFVYAIGSQSTQLVRDKIFTSLGLSRSRFPAIVHPKADIDPSAQVGHGCIIHPGACLGAGSQLCDFAILAVNSALAPNSKVNEFAMVTSLVLVLSRAEVGRMAFVGSLTCILEDVHIGDFSRVGVGSVVSRNIPENAVAMGNPARVLGKNTNSVSSPGKEL
jgi:sugar O-acyltransferase (sialic acid O-acetyltransferase NeuD family)